MKKIRILFTGGGSGGHVYPLVAVAQKVKELAPSASFDLRYFGDSGEYAGLLTANGLKRQHIVSSKLRRYFSFKNVVDFFKFFIALFQSIWKVFWFMPDAVFSKGGPGSLPVIFASKFFGLPVVIHESDSVPGLTNLISGKISRKVFLAFDAAKKYFPREDTEVVGNPVRRDLLAGNADSAAMITADGKKEAKKKFGLNPEKPVLLVLGGSQGARALNNFVGENLDALTAHFQIIHQVGEANYKEYSEAIPTKDNYKFYGYLGEELKDAYIAADFALARAGAGTIFELAYFGVPSVLIPLPDAANDHQNLNAIEYEEAGGCVDIEQENFLSHLVLMQLESLISDNKNLEKMSAAASRFYRPLSADKIAAYLLSLCGVKVNQQK